MTAISLPTPIPAIHPDTGKAISIVGVEMHGIGARFIVIMDDGDELYADVIAYANKEEPNAGQH